MTEVRVGRWELQAQSLRRGLWEEIGIDDLDKSALTMQNNKIEIVNVASYFSTEWESFHGRVIGVNFYTLPNLCEISPDGPSPSCHLGDGYTDLVIVKDSSRLQMKSHIQRNFNSKDQVRC